MPCRTPTTIRRLAALLLAVAAPLAAQTASPPRRVIRHPLLLPAAPASSALPTAATLAPIVLRVTPVSVTAGSRVVVQLAGTHFSPAMQVDFGAGVQVLGAPRVAGSELASLVIQVAASAPLGRHAVTASILLPGTLQRLQGNGPAGIEVLHAPPPAQMVGGFSVLGITPAQVQQGQRITLQLRGAGYRVPFALSFGPGVSALGPVQILGSALAQLPVQVAALAPPGLRHPALLVREDAHGTVSPAATLTITATPVPLPSRQPPRSILEMPVVLAVAPQILQAGQQYTLTLRGLNFTQQMQPDFGAGAHVIGGVRLQSASLANVDVQVDAGAAPGLRWVGLNVPPGLVPVRQDASVLVQPLAVAQSAPWSPPVMRGPPPVPQLGQIILDGPGYFAGAGGEIPTPPRVPLLNEETDFQWHEANPGLADRYEVRFFHDGTLIATRSISAPSGLPLPHDLPADTALQAELETKISGRAPQPTRIGGPVVADVTWQVVGFHTYFATRVSPSAITGSGATIHASAVSMLGASAEVVVEQSKPVPISSPQEGDPLLDLPAGPTGLACTNQRNTGIPASASTPSGGGGSGPVALQNLDLGQQNASGGGVSLATANYTGNRWKLTGGFDLSEGPWALHQSASDSPMTPQPFNVYTLHNVYLDWGDGEVDPLVMSAWGQYCAGQTIGANQDGDCSPGFDSLTGSPTAFNFDQDIFPDLHRYTEPGDYTVRIYELASADVQQQGATPVSLGAGSGGLYGGMLRMGLASQSIVAATAPMGVPGSANRAYMVFCQDVVITPRTDSAADGPLQLKSIALTGFPGGAPAAAHVVHTGHVHASLAQGSASPSVPMSHRELPALDGGPGHGRGVAGAFGNIPSFCSCDVSLTGGASLAFTGQGYIKLDWFVDRQPVGSMEVPVGPSPARSDAQLGSANPPPPILGTLAGLLSPSLSLGQPGRHTLDVMATVDTNPPHPVGSLQHALLSLAAGKPLDAATAAQMATALQGAPPLGVLGPRGMGTARLPPIVWFHNAPRGAPQVAIGSQAAARGLTGRLGGGSGPQLRISAAPDEVSTLATNLGYRSKGGTLAYLVTSADPHQPCTFTFPVQGGSFIVAGLQHNGTPTVHESGGKFYGDGQLLIQLPDASSGEQSIHVPIRLDGWTMQADGVTVASGSFDASHPYSLPVQTPALIAHLDELKGTAGQTVSATLSAQLQNTDILGTDAKAPQWQGVSATLSPQGDWYADHVPMPELQIYDSGFVLKPGTATLDLSRAQGAGADTSACQGNSGASWMGVRFPDNTPLQAFDFNLPQPPSQNVSGWAIDSSGFCGNATFAAATIPLDQGSFHWDSIAASAAQGRFKADYQGIRVHVPWLDADVGSNGVDSMLQAGQGSSGGAITLNLTSPPVTRNEGPITLIADHLQFHQLQGVGFTVRSDTTLTFASQQGTYAQHIVLDDYEYAMDGAGYFGDGSSSRHLDLSGQQGQIGSSVVNLKSLDVQSFGPSSTTRLGFAFDSTLRLSGSLPAADVPVNYSISNPAPGTYNGIGPQTTPFHLQVPFPDANPTTQLNLNPTYVQGTPSAPSSQVIFYGAMDMAMFGGPPVKGYFLLGDIGSNTYWIAKAVLDLGPSGVPLVPPFLNLYDIGGGLGHDVTLDSFKNPDLKGTTAVDDGSLIFDATMMVGSPDHTTFGLSGDFAIKPGGQDPGGRMDYQAWVMNPDWSGNGDFQGYFSYSGGIFDGALNGQLSLADNAVSLSAQHDAIHMHAGGGQWYFHFGTQQNPITGHLLFINQGLWMDIGSDGFALGALGNVDVDVGHCNDACAYLHASWLMSASITPTPLHFAAQASLNASAGACLGFCLSAGLSADAEIALPPPYAHFGFSLSACPLGKLHVGLQVLPSPQPDLEGDSCL